MKNKINFYRDEFKLNRKFPFYKSVKDIKRIVKYISNELNEKIELSIYVCDSTKIKSLNNEHRNKNSSTDVLSFPHNEHEENYLYIGDIFVNEDILVSQAKEINSDPITEFTFLVMHGILHLIGYDHMSEKDEEKMTLKQREIFKNLKIRNW